MEKLTIVMVSYFSEKYIGLNLSLIRKLNPGTSFKFILIDNSKRKRKQGSYHHAEGLNSSLSRIKTKYALFVDPDFFFVRKYWIREIIEFMEKNKVAVLGAPYHPSRYMKYRYFPSAICMFVDLGKIQREDLDFTPDFAISVGIHPESQVPQTEGHLKQRVKKNRLLVKILAGIANYYQKTFRRDKIIGSSKDTGIRIYRKFKDSSVYNILSFIPVYRRSDYCWDLFERWLSFLLPDNLCYVPKGKKYFSEIGFRELGIYDVNRLGWEEYLWQNKALGFHIGGVFQGINKVNISRLEKLLALFIKG